VRFRRLFFRFAFAFFFAVFAPAATAPAQTVRFGVIGDYGSNNSAESEVAAPQATTP